MRTKKKLALLFMDLLQEIYAKCEPPLDFKAFSEEVKNSGVEPPNWFSEHTTSEAIITEIETAFRKKHRITEKEWGAMVWDRLAYYPRTI